MTEKTFPDKEFHVCEHGSVEQAYQTAVKLTVDSVALQCNAWALQVASFQRTLAIDVQMYAGRQSLTDVQQFCNALNRWHKDYGLSPEELVRRIAERRSGVHALPDAYWRN